MKEMNQQKHKLCGLAAICVALVLTSLNAQGQASPAANTPITSEAVTPASPVTTEDRVEHHQHHGYGWVGLLGLLGLAGLMRRRDNYERVNGPVRHPDARP